MLSVGKRFLRWLRPEEPGPRSVYFLTFHKCASTLFSEYVLKNVEGLQAVDYASKLYLGEPLGELVFERYGALYGPIRVSASPDSLVYKKLVAPVCEGKFLRKRIAVFLIRDPRDMLVSAYHSYGWSHGLSPVPEIRDQQEAHRKDIQSMTVDEYALGAAADILKNFQTVLRIRRACRRNVVLKYEDMINKWDCFARGLTRFLHFKPDVLQEIHDRSRPPEREDRSSHRRSGKVAGFRDQLKAETIASLDRTFRPVLSAFEYQALTGPERRSRRAA
jgi:hypothetical protein